MGRTAGLVRGRLAVLRVGVGGGWLVGALVTGIGCAGRSKVEGDECRRRFGVLWRKCMKSCGELCDEQNLILSPRSKALNR